MEFGGYGDLYEGIDDTDEGIDEFEGITTDIVRHGDGSDIPEERNDLAGEPMEAMERWHRQEGEYACAVACQEFAIEELLDVSLSESELAETARLREWYDPQGGTPMSDMSKLIEQFGLEAEQHFDTTLSDVEDALDAGGKVIAGVNDLFTGLSRGRKRPSLLDGESRRRDHRCRPHRLWIREGNS